MASTDATAIPVKNQAYRVTFPILDADGDLVAGATGLDSEVSKDAGTFTDCTSEATQIATSSGMYYLDLTADEMNADTVAIIVKSTEGKTVPIVLYPKQAGDISVTLEADAVSSTALATSAVTEITDAVKALVVESQGSITLQQALSVILSSVAGVTASGGLVFKSPNGNANRISATVNASNERTAITLTPSS